MQYYSELRYSSFSSSAIERSHRHHAPRIRFTRRLCFFKRCEFHPRHGPWYWRPSWKSVGRGFDGWQSTHWAGKMWCPVVCTLAQEGPAGTRSLPACVRCCSITAVLSCKDQPIASGNCRDSALTPHSYIHKYHLLLQVLRLVPLGRNL